MELDSDLKGLCEFQLLADGIARYACSIADSRVEHNARVRVDLYALSVNLTCSLIGLDVALPLFISLCA